MKPGEIGLEQCDKLGEPGETRRRPSFHHLNEQRKSLMTLSFK
jgi:hypothetical protein